MSSLVARGGRGMSAPERVALCLRSVTPRATLRPAPSPSRET